MAGTLDVTKYVKRNYDEIKDIILKMADPHNITRTLIMDLFSNKATKLPGGKYKVDPPKYNITDYFDLPAGILKNQPKAVPDTTFGIFIYNSLVINNAFHSKISYINDVMNSDNMGKLQNIISENLLNGNLTVAEFGEYCNTTVWLGYFTEIVMPGFSLDLTYSNPEIMKLKVKLLKENADLVNKKIQTSTDVARYSNNIEKQLISEAKKELASNPGIRLFDLSKPSFENNYKNCCITNGSLYDPVTGKYTLNTNSYSEGHTIEAIPALANKTITASTSRSVATQEGGTWSKYLSAALQNICVDKRGSDCGSTKTLSVVIDKAHLISYQYNYCIINGKNVLMTPEFMKQNIGKTVNMRTPMYCKGNILCNCCAGDLVYRLGIKNIGLTGSVASGKQMNLSMKAMHDITIHPIAVDVMNDTLFSK